MMYMMSTDILKKIIYTIQSYIFMKRAIAAHRANRDECDRGSKRAKTGAEDAPAKQDVKAT